MVRSADRRSGGHGGSKMARRRTCAHQLRQVLTYKQGGVVGTPNIALTFEPVESGAAVYAPLAPKSAGSAGKGQFALKMWVQNNSPANVHVNQLKISFIGAPAVNPVTIALDLNVAPGASKSWFFSTADMIVLPVPAPATVKLAVSCDGFDTPAAVMLPLIAHKSPTPAASYRCPARAPDLAKG